MSALGTHITCRRTLALVGLASLAAVAVAGCGGGSGGSKAPTSGSTPANGGPVTLSVASSGVGDVLIDSDNRSLYLFKKDTGPKSSCFGACAHNWPPVRTNAKPIAGSGAEASLIGTIKRSDGGSQVTYNGHPLYLFIKDQKPGQTTGQGVTAFGAPWFALTPAGTQDSAPASSSAGGASSGGGYGY
jgi:predicted lipoprotein with Yx(FWY)xxD motif